MIIGKKNKVELELKGPQKKKTKPYKNQTASRSYFVLLRFFELKFEVVYRVQNETNPINRWLATTTRVK